MFLKVYKDIISTMKEMRSLLTFFGISGASVISFSNEAMNLFIQHLPLVFLVSIFTMFMYMERTRKAMNERLILVEHNQRVSSLKQSIDSMYKEYGNKPIADELVIKSLYARRDELIELGVNSYTQGKLEKMISNIVL